MIWRLWQSGEVIDAFPSDLVPNSRRDGYAVQAGLQDFSSEPRYGWKIAATSLAGQRHIGVDQPLAGRLLAETIVGDGATVPVSSNRMRVVEPEFAFRLARSLPARAEPYPVAEVMSAVGDLYLCLELPDSRFRDFATVGGPSLIADNACAWMLVVGERVTADWRSLDLADHPVHATVGDRYTRDGIGSNVLGDPCTALTWLVNEVSGLGLNVRKGDLITTGTCTVPLEVEPGDRVVADFGALGSISVAVSA